MIDRRSTVFVFRRVITAILPAKLEGVQRGVEMFHAWFGLDSRSTPMSGFDGHPAHGPGGRHRSSPAFIALRHREG